MIDNTFSGLEHNIENIDPTNNKLYIETANLSLEVWNRKQITDNFFISDFFGVYNYNTKLKFLVLFFNNNNKLIFKGIIYKSGTNFPVREHERLKLTIVSFEKEFKEYYKNKFLKEVEFNPDPDHYGYQTAGITGIIRANLDSAFIRVNLSEGINNWSMTKYPYLFSYAPGYSFQFINSKTGYESFRRDNCSIYDWLNSFCLPMGWIWLFYNGEFYIKERCDLSFPVLEIDYNHSNIEHAIENRLNDIRVDNIIIDDGNYYSNKRLLSPVGPGGIQYLGGTRKNVYSNINYYNNKNQPYYSIGFTPNVYEIQYNNKTMIFLDEGEKDFRFHEYSVYQTGTQINRKLVTYPRNNTLILNPYINSEQNAAGLDISLARTSGGYIDIGNGNFFASNIPMGNNDFRYTGHAANSLVRYNSQMGLNEQFPDYILRQSFKRNFAPFIRSEQEILMTIKTNLEITDPFQVIKIKNYPYYDFGNKLMSIQGLNCDPFTKNSEIKILI